MKILRKTFLLVIAAGSIPAALIAQTKDNWVGVKVNNWSYPLNIGNADVGNTGGNGSISKEKDGLIFKKADLSKKSVAVGNSFLQAPPSGNSRILIGHTETGNGKFSIVKSGNQSALIMSASESRMANKFAVYDIKEASPVAKISFSIKFNNTPVDGNCILAIGKRSTRLFDGDASIATNRLHEDIFTTLRWGMTAKGMNFSYRIAEEGNTQAQATNKTDVKHPFVKGNIYKVELYCNNGSESQKYERDGKTYTVPTRAYHLWVDGNILTYGRQKTDFPASMAELKAGEELNSFLFLGQQSTKPTPNALEITLSDIRYSFADTVSK